MNGEKRKSSLRFIWLGVIAALVLGVVCFYPRILPALARWLDVGQRPHAADYVMVLPGGPDRRPFVAASMIRRGLVKGVLTAETETNPAHDEGLQPTTENIMRRILELRGVRNDQIQVLPGKSESTWTDAQALARFMKAHPQETVAIVTDCYHTRRSRWVFHRVLGADYDRVFFVSAPLDNVPVDSWWKTEDGLMIYLSEYFKLVLYLAGDRLTLTWVAIGIIIIGIFPIAIRRLKKPQIGDAPSVL